MTIKRLIESVKFGNVKKLISKKKKKNKKTTVTTKNPSKHSTEKMSTRKIF